MAIFLLSSASGAGDCSALAVLKPSILSILTAFIAFELHIWVSTFNSVTFDSLWATLVGTVLNCDAPCRSGLSGIRWAWYQVNKEQGCENVGYVLKTCVFFFVLDVGISSFSLFSDWRNLFLCGPWANA